VNRTILFLAGLVLASTAQAQTPDRTLRSHITVTNAFAATPSSTTSGPADPTPVLRISGERALLSPVDEDRTRSAESAGFTDAPIDGSRALLGNWPSASPVGAVSTERRRSSFRAEVRGDVASNAWGEAEFGAVQTGDHSSAVFVVSLGVCGEQSAVLFTRRSGTPLEAGRYRITEGADGENEILALVMTGSSTRPTGVFRGESGWLVVTEASGQLTAGHFQIDAVGFTAAEPELEDRHVNVTGSFSATTASSSFRVCDNAE
jgi:hypothetical protein